MNKFRKILFTVIAFTLLALTLCVVASASTARAAVKDAVVLRITDYENNEAGASAESNATGKGEFKVAVAENGNKYVQHKNVDGTDSGTSYLKGPYQLNNTYSMADYPYLAFDFDVAKIGTSYAGATINAIAYGNGPLYDTMGEVTSTLKYASGPSYSVNFAKFSSHLPAEQYKWTHVTAIFRYVDVDGDPYISFYVFLNGNLVYEDYAVEKIDSEYPIENLYFATFRINNSGSSSSSKISGYDNYQLTYFTDG